MADQRPGSYARSIDPEGGIKGPDLSAAFDKAQEQPRAAEQTHSNPPVASQQVADTNLSPREPAPHHAYDQAKAAEHRQAMQTDDKAAKQAYLQEKAKKFLQQDRARKAKGPPTLGKDFDRGRGLGDD